MKIYQRLLVAVDQEISLVVLSRRLECLLDCGTNSIKDGWTLKYSSTISKYGDAKDIAANLAIEFLALTLKEK